MCVEVTMQASFPASTIPSNKILPSYQSLVFACYIFLSEAYTFEQTPRASPN